MVNRNLDKELIFSTSRSSGAGGQHVNKTETKVELRFNILKSQILTEAEKQILIPKLQHRLTNEGDLIIVSQRYRSQLRNKEDCIKRFYAIIEKSLKVNKIRKRTHPSKAWHEKRMEEKKMRSEKKERRKKLF